MQRVFLSWLPALITWKVVQSHHCIATYSQPIENSSTAACISGNAWQMARLERVCREQAEQLSLWRGHLLLEHLPCGPPKIYAGGVFSTSPATCDFPALKPNTLGTWQRLIHEKSFRLQHACIIAAQSYQVASYCPMIIRHRFQLLASLWALGVGPNHAACLTAIPPSQGSQTAFKARSYPASASKQKVMQVFGVCLKLP